MRRVVCAANRFPCGTVILGVRHWDRIMCDTADALSLAGGDEEQGFVDNLGNFISREEARDIALRADQIYRETGMATDELYSEHLY